MAHGGESLKAGNSDNIFVTLVLLMGPCMRNVTILGGPQTHRSLTDRMNSPFGPKSFANETLINVLLLVALRVRSEHGGFSEKGKRSSLD